MVKSISILGSTGSIGRQTLSVAERLNIPVKALSAGSNIKLLEEQARKFMPRFVCVFDPKAARALKTALSDTPIKVGDGMAALQECASAYAECVVTAVTGSVGLMPTLAAIDEGRRIALANKETLVCAGEIVMERAREKNAKILPVDSEHSAIFQCLLARGGANDKNPLRRIWLTASGGPFREKSREELKNISPEAALSHPNWSMGAKISVDSATMMNKGLEFIEAMHLFSVSPDEIKVIIHPESIIHSMVEYIDGALIAQLGLPDMACPIQYALTYPSRKEAPVLAPDFARLGKLTFFDPEPEKFPCLTLAIDCARRGGSCAAIMNAANEEAVNLFLTRKLGFNRIYDIVEKAVSTLSRAGNLTLEELQEADREARAFVLGNWASLR